MNFRLLYEIFKLKTEEERASLALQIEELYDTVDLERHKIKLLCMYYALTEYKYD